MSETPPPPPPPPPPPGGQGYGQGWAPGPGPGQPPPPGYYGAPGAPGPSNGMGTAALVLGIVGFLGSFVVGLGAPFAVAGIVLGFIGVNKVKKGEATNRSQAIGGIVTGAIGVVISILWVVLLVFVADEAGNFVDCLDEADTDQEIEECGERFEDQLDNLDNN